MEKQNKKENKKGFKVVLYLAAFCTWFMSFNSVVSADGIEKVGESAGTWILDQIFWIGLVALAFALLSCLAKKAWVTAIVTGLGGGIVLFFVKNPSILETMGSSLMRMIGIG